MGKKRKLRISVRFFLMFFLFTALVIGAFSFFISTYFSQILVENEYNSFQTLTSSFEAQVENEIRVMDKVSINILYSSLVRDNFSRFLREPARKMENFSNILEIFVALNGAEFSLPLIALYSSEGEKIIMASYSIIEKTDLASLDWVAEAERVRYKKVISQPYQSNMLQASSSASDYYLSLYRALQDGEGRESGYIETGQKARKIFGSIINYQKTVDSGLKVYVFNGKGDLIFPYETIPLSRVLQEYYFSFAGAEGPARESVNPRTEKRELLYSETSFYTGWTYVCVQDRERILEPVRAFSRILLYATILTLLAVTIISLYMSTSITRPIRALLNRIHSTNIDTLSDEKAHLHSSYDEFDDLNDSFHRMNENIKRSMDELLIARHREMESLFMALQSQINPHFYYNSLSSIVALTEEHRDQEVIQFCDNLSRFMRYSARNQPGPVTLAMEMEHARKYLYCMKVRYQSSLTYGVSEDEDLKNIAVPRLIIQPILENALKYGTDCAPPWHISLETRKVSGGWTVTVKDSGTGFTEEALGELKGKMANWRDEVSAEHGEASGGLGLINVYSRWKIFCGESFFFDIDSTGEGSTITLGQVKKEDLRG